MPRPYEKITDSELIDMWEKEVQGTNILWIAIISILLALTWQYLRLAFYITLGISIFYVLLFWLAFPPKKKRRLEEEIKWRGLW